MQDVLFLKNLPQDLKFNGLWCCWKLTEKGKIPFNPINDTMAKSNDPETFVTYPVLLSKLHKYFRIDENGKQTGGVGLGIFRGFSAIDIDHCVDSNGNLTDMARDIIEYCKSYTEYSPSGTGIRIILRTQTKIDKNEYYINNANNGLEIYISENTNKFVTITGNRISENYDKINDITLKPILDKYMRKNVFNLEKILKKDAKLNELWNNIAPGSHSNESELDMALCCKLAFYLKNDASEIERYFKMSPYYLSKDELHKRKWDTPDYVQRTLQGATQLIQPNIVYQQPATIRHYDLNDTGNATRFVEQFGDVVRYNVDNDVWMLWNGNYWEYDIKEKIKSYVEIMAEQMLFESNSESDLNTRTRILRNIDHIYNSSGKEALLKEARHFPGIAVMNNEFDCNPYYICTNNGVIDLKTGTILEPKKEMMISNTTGCNIDVENEPVLFNKFINDIFNGNKELTKYIQKAFGYSMTESAREQCMFILHGDGNNGKSLLLDVIKNALGSYGITTRPQLLTEQKFSSNSEEIARLKGKRFVAIEEIKCGDKLDEQLVKSLTSGIGNQVARFLYGNSFEFAFKGKMWMATNYEPVITGTDKGIWRRIKKIPLNVDFTGKEDKDLRDKLLNELPQILGWIFKGYRMYMQEGLNEPKEIVDATKQYREEMDVVQQWINECCECSDNFYERANTLYENYRAYMQRRDQKTNQTIFGRNLSKKFKKKQYSTGIVYIGIRIRTQAENLAKKVEFDRIKINDLDI